MTLDISDTKKLRNYTEAVTLIARDAGAQILQIYDRGFDVDTKTDGSPVTTADQHSHALIVKELEKLTPDRVAAQMVLVLVLIVNGLVLVGLYASGALGRVILALFG